MARILRLCGGALDTSLDPYRSGVTSLYSSTQWGRCHQTSHVEVDLLNEKGGLEGWEIGIADGKRCASLGSWCSGSPMDETWPLVRCPATNAGWRADVGLLRLITDWVRDPRF